MDSYRGQEYNPFAPAMSNSGGAMEAGIPQLPAAQAAAMAEQDPSVKEQAIGVAMDKGLNYGVDKGAGMLEAKLAGLGAKSAPAFTQGAMSAGPMAYLQTAAGNTIGGGATTAATAAGKGGAAAGGTAASGGLAAAGAAMAPVLPFVIGAMALKSIFKK
jgi:hypothetical protein